jgi:hypothetical protein
MEVNYHKGKNTDIFKSLENPTMLNLSTIRNYLPTYNRFFNLNETNYNAINLNNEFQIHSINYKEKELENIFNCTLVNLNTKKKKECSVFIKLAPLLDPYKYLVGKYDINDEHLFNLPTLINENVHPKIKNINNSAYVDSFFTFLNSKLITHHNFIHGVNYFASFLAIKKQFTLNIIDDLEYLAGSEFFNKHKNVLFKVDDYDNILEDEEEVKLPPVKIEYNHSLSNLSVDSFNDDAFEGIFSAGEQPLSLSDEMCEVMVDVTDTNGHNSFTVKSSSTCSSRSSHTSVSETDLQDDDLQDLNDNLDEDLQEDEDDDEDDEDDDDEDEDDEEDDDNLEDETVNVTLEQFPVQLIFMEQCKNTLDDILLTQELTYDEWCSCLMQIIMILITYQKTFGFTHNDLHTNNVMFTQTDEKFLFYCYNDVFYKVPTFGRLFKIIDFGRSIYKFKGNIFCSDSFKNGEDAASQYNTEPFFNENKPRLEPNYSFDICRLACSIFDYLIEDITKIKNIDLCNPMQQLIYDWCLDDKGINMLYKANGTDRYPDFKLYKMIARNVHNHTPQAQLHRKEFNRYIYKDGKNSKNGKNCRTAMNFVNIDKMPNYT